MADETTKFESAQALFCSIADYVGQPKIENVLNVTTYPTYASFLKGSQLRPKETNLDIAKAAYAKCDTPEMSFTAITSFLKNKGWYESSVWIAKHLIKTLGSISRLTKFSVLDDRGFVLGYRYVRGDKDVMQKLESLYSICNEANKNINKLPGPSSEIEFGNVNKWSPADIYFASKTARQKIAAELTKAQKKGGTKYFFGGKNGLNKFISQLIASGHLLPLSLKKAGKTVKIEKVNFSKKTKATILENVNYSSKTKNEANYNTTTKLWVNPAPRLSSDNNGTPLVSGKIFTGNNLGKIPAPKKGDFPTFTVGVQDPKKYKFNDIFKLGTKKAADIIKKMSDDDKKKYKDFEYNYLEHLDKQIKTSRAGEVPKTLNTDSRDMVIPIIDITGSNKGNIQMRHDPSGKYGSWKVDFKYTGSGARGGSVVSYKVYSAMLKIVDPVAGQAFFDAWEKGVELYAAAKHSPNGDAPDIYFDLGLTKKQHQYYGPRGLENDPPIYLKSEFQKAQKKTGYNRERLKKMRWKGSENVFDYQRGELSGLCVINRVMPIMTKFWGKNKEDSDAFCQMVFKYVTSRTDTSARFVIAK